MDVLLIVPDFGPEENGGGAVMAEILARGLSLRKHKVTVVAASASPGLRFESRETYQIIWVHRLHFRVVTASLPQAEIYMPVDPSSLLSLKRHLLCQREPDIIHLFAFPMHIFVDMIGLMTRMLYRTRKPTITTIHAYPGFLEKQGPASRTLKVFYVAYLKTMGNLLLSISDKIVAVSPSTSIAASRHGVLDKKLVTIPNGLNLSNDVHNESGANFQRPKITLVSVGRVTRHKGYEYVLYALNELKTKHKINLEYYVIGSVVEPSYSEHLKTIKHQLNLDNCVHFVGYVDEERKIDLVTDADIFIAPSLDEGFGLSLLEAMAYGKLVIATRIPGHADLLSRFPKCLIPPADYNSLASRILEYKNDAIEGRNLANLLKEEALKYTSQMMVSSYEKLYSELVDGTRQAQQSREFL